MTTVPFAICWHQCTQNYRTLLSRISPVLFYTAEQQCVSKAEFDRMVTQMATQTAAVENELNTWKMPHILKRFLLDNPGKESVTNTGHWW